MPLKNIRKILFRLFVFLLPTQLAIHFWPSWSFLYGIRIDYFAPTLYVTDLIVLLFVVLFLVSLYKNIKFSRRELVFLGGLVAFSILNVSNSLVWQIAFFKWLKVYELLLFAKIVITDGIDFNSDFIKPFSLSVIFFSLVTIIQFSIQRTIGGAFYLLGERSFTLTTPGISTVTIFGKEHLRAYSSFSHPNSLGGFFLITLALLSFPNNDKHPILKKWGSVLSIVSILLSFSLSAYLGLLLLGAIYLIRKKTLTKNLLVFGFYVSLVFSLFLPIVSGYIKDVTNLERSVLQRLFLAQASGKIVSQNPIVGVGLNNFLISLTKTSSSWPEILQPVHNIFLLTFSELGIVGLLLFSGLLFFALKKNIEENKLYLGIAIMLIVFTGLVDHYWLTLNQNQLLLTLVFVFSFI